MGRVEEIISARNIAEAEAVNFRNLYQDAADFIFPRENQIIRKSSPGERKMNLLVDTTAVLASIEMASGLSQNLIAPGQRFFLYSVSDSERSKLDVVKRYLSKVTDITHEKLFDSNFVLELNETLRSLVVFGTGNIFSEWDQGLNFRDYDIARYLIRENNKGRIDTVYIDIFFTARQAFQEWGDKAGKSILAAIDEKKDTKKFKFIHLVQPREKRNARFSDSSNMPFESIYVSEKDKVIVSEGGFNEMPYHVARWTRSSNEVYGRGRGTFVLPRVKQLQNIYRDFIECGNRHNNPPLLVSDLFDGEVRTSPGALNHVTDMDAIKAIPQNALGNFVISKDVLDGERELVRNAFFNDVFNQLAQLKGDRRTTLEIRERIGEGLHRLGPPIGRLWEELIDPLVVRTYFLLLRNGELPPPPPELQGSSFKIEHIGRLALELKSGQARGVQQLIASVAEIEAVFPGASDNINFDSAIRRLANTLEVNTEDIASEEELAARREARAAEQQRQQQLQMAQMAAEGYSKTNKTPEEGSPAKQVTEALGG